MSCDHGDRDRNDTAANGGSLEPPETERERGKNRSSIGALKVVWPRWHLDVGCWGGPE